MDNFNRHAQSLASKGVAEIRVVHIKSLSQKLFDVAMFGGVLFITWKMMGRVLDKMHQAEGDDGQSEKLKMRIIRSLNRIGRKVKPFHTNTYEDALLQYVTLPQQLNTTFADIGGLGSQKKSIRDTVLMPLKHFDILKKKSALLCPPAGILFYGPPGTGKTLMAKAIAKTATATFLYLKISSVMSKWYGETSKLISAVFTLAHKLAPTIIFIDELDAFLGKRRAEEQTADAHAKALFLSLWDGLSTTSYQGVIVLGCTNRPSSIDEAVLRRLPRQYEFSLPSESDRKEILDIFLKKTNHQVRSDIIAKHTDRFTGSDIQELCKVACGVPLQELLSSIPEGLDLSEDDLSLRPVTMDDFKLATQKVKPSWVNAEVYRRRGPSAYRKSSRAPNELNDLD